MKQNYMVYTRVFINSLLLKEPNLVSGLKATPNFGTQGRIERPELYQFYLLQFHVLEAKAN